MFFIRRRYTRGSRSSISSDSIRSGNSLSIAMGSLGVQMPWIHACKALPLSGFSRMESSYSFNFQRSSFGQSLSLSNQQIRRGNMQSLCQRHNTSCTSRENMLQKKSMRMIHTVQPFQSTSSYTFHHGIVEEEPCGNDDILLVKDNDVSSSLFSFEHTTTNDFEYPNTWNDISFPIPCKKVAKEHSDGWISDPQKGLPEYSQILGVRDGFIKQKYTRPDLKETAFDNCETLLHTDKVAQEEAVQELTSIYSKILVVNNLSLAEDVVHKLTGQYRHVVHACDTEVAKIDLTHETPVEHGEMICFSIYSGPDSDFGNGKSCIWVDVLDGGGEDLLVKFAPFFENPSIKKVWHNYSFDKHIFHNHGIAVSGFHADTMHMARLWDSSRSLHGYSLEALSSDKNAMCGTKPWSGPHMSKVSMKSLFGKKNLKKDGSEGKLVSLPPPDVLQRGEERVPWICYSALDSITTLRLYKSLKSHLSKMPWKLDDTALVGKSMFDFYTEYFLPFGELLVTMEKEGILVNRAFLSEMEAVAKAEQAAAAGRFCNWASEYCPDAKYMNVRSSAQVRQLLFGGAVNRKDPTLSLPESKAFKVLNSDNIMEPGKKTPKKHRTITLCKIGSDIPVEHYTPSGWPSTCADALKSLAGKVSAKYDLLADNGNSEGSDETWNGDGQNSHNKSTDVSAYGTAFCAFPLEEEGARACHAIASLLEVSSIDCLISNFLMPLQGSNISSKDGRIHCSLNINTETGRLSARRPNLQNQPAFDKDRYRIRQAFIPEPGNSFIVADYGQLELRILAHLSNCKSMLDAFKAGGDFHSRTAMNMYGYIRDAVDSGRVLLEWFPETVGDRPPVPLLKDAFASERKKAKMLNFSIAYGKTPVGLARDWKVSVEMAKETVELWYKERGEVLRWQENCKEKVKETRQIHTLLGRTRQFPSLKRAGAFQRGHIERAAINTPVQGSAADVVMCAMLEIAKNPRLKEIGWRLLLQVHDEVILEGPKGLEDEAKAIVMECMSKPFGGKNILKVDLHVEAKCGPNWYSAK